MPELPAPTDRFTGRLLVAVSWLTSPLTPDDYLGLINPLLCARHPAGRVTQVRPETADATTLVTRPRLERAPGRAVSSGRRGDRRRTPLAYVLPHLLAGPGGRTALVLGAQVLSERGAEDAGYIRTVIAAQRGLEAGGRVALTVSLFPPAWVAGTAMLATAKILENMELGHNILHGQWDWMGDPAIHSTTWDWDFLTPTDAWKHTHNHLHHTFTNVVGRDRDLGYTVLRMSPEQPWHPLHLAQPLYNALLAPVFEWGIALYDLEAEAVPAGRKSPRAFLGDLAGLARKATRQLAKDYVLFPLLAGPSALPCLLGNLTANTVRNCVYGYPAHRGGAWCQGLRGGVPQDIAELTTSGRVFAIAELMVLPLRRRNHIASRLQQRLLARIDAELVTTLVEPTNMAARAAYRSWGWTRAGQVDPGEGRPELEVWSRKPMY